MTARRGKLDINNAGLEELVSLPDVGPALARNIVAARPFRRLAELRQVPGIGDKLFDQLREYVRVPRPASRRSATTSATEQDALLGADSASRATLDVNTADLDQLTELPGVGPALARRIVAARPFLLVADLKRVPGIGATLYSRIRPHIQFSAPSAQMATSEEDSAAAPSREPASSSEARADRVPDAPGVLRPVAEVVDTDAPAIDQTFEETIGYSGMALPGAPEDYETEETPAGAEASEAPRRVDEQPGASPPAADFDAPSVPVTTPPGGYRRPRSSPWTLWGLGVFGLIVFAVVLATIIALGRKLSTSNPAAAPVTAEISAASISQPTDTSQPATAMSSPAVAAAPTETPDEDQSSTVERATLPAASATPTQAIATSTEEPTSTPAASSTPAIALGSNVPFTLGNILWSEDFDPPLFNWGRGLTSIADAGYAGGALQATMLTRVEPFWSIGPTYRVGAANYLYEGDVIVQACAGKDFYGLLFRVDFSDFYAFTVSCDGSFRLLRRMNGHSEILQMAQSPLIPMGPGVQRLGVLVLGTQINLYVNGQVIADYEEHRLDRIPAGDFGVYARMVTSSSLMVRWDNLMATAVTARAQ